MQAAFEALLRVRAMSRTPQFSRGVSNKAYFGKMPQLNEADLDESFVRGSGPGGQSINKTNISVSLIHKPTGTRVQCHQTRSRERNRELARRIMRERLDLLANPGSSVVEQKWDAERTKKMAKLRKTKRKLKRKKEGSGDGDTDVQAEQESVENEKDHIE